jgi:plasmid replication initiation protein
MATMEHPVFSLATRPDLRVLRYRHNDVEVTVTPSVRGLATIHDKDVLIYCVSQLMAAINAGRATSRTLHLRARDLMQATARECSGDGYRRLRDAFERLAGTRITTNIVAPAPDGAPDGAPGDASGGGLEITEGFGLIEAWRIVRRARGGRMVSVAVTLSEWLYRLVISKSVLTLSRAYFSLRRPLERRVYELARKHCGRQPAWRVSAEVLQKKSGSTSPRRVFRRMLREMAAAQPLPDYLLEEEEGDVWRVTPRPEAFATGGLAGGASGPGGGPGGGTGAAPAPLRAETMEEARRIRPGMDVYALEAEWRAVWDRTGRRPLRSADAAFLGWLRKGTGA